MKKVLIVAVLLICLLLTGCESVSIGLIGGADGPTSIFLSDNDVEKVFRKKYVNERKLPRLDIDIENSFVSDDRKLILDDRINNELEFMIYDYYHKLTSGSFKEAKEIIADGSLYAATEAYENNFKDGIYYSQIFIDEIDLVDKDDLDEISYKNKQDIVNMLSDLKIDEFAIVEIESVIRHNDKSISMVPQVGNSDVNRYFLLGKKDGSYKIIEVYWEAFMFD